MDSHSQHGIRSFRKEGHPSELMENRVKNVKKILLVLGICWVTYFGLLYVDSRRLSTPLPNLTLEALACSAVASLLILVTWFKTQDAARVTILPVLVAAFVASVINIAVIYAFHAQGYPQIFTDNWFSAVGPPAATLTAILVWVFAHFIKRRGV